MSRNHDLETIYRDFHPKILRYLQRLCGEEDAADLAQTVFLNVSRSLDSFRGESYLSTWIYWIATNAARDHESRPPYHFHRTIRGYCHVTL